MRKDKPPYEFMMSASGALLMELEASRSGQVFGWLKYLEVHTDIAQSGLMRNVEKVSTHMGDKEGPMWADAIASKKKPGEDFQRGARPAIWLVQRVMPEEFRLKMLSVYSEKFAGHTQLDRMRHSAQHDRDRAEVRARQATYDYADLGLGAAATRPLVNRMQAWVGLTEASDMERTHMRRGFGYVLQLAIDAQWQLEAGTVLSNPAYNWDDDFIQQLGE